MFIEASSTSETSSSTNFDRLLPLAHWISHDQNHWENPVARKPMNHSDRQPESRLNSD